MSPLSARAPPASRRRGAWPRSRLKTVVLEASARVGGRAWTHRLAGAPLDLGCGWLHSGERNAWARVAETMGVAIDRRTAAWGAQYQDRGFSPAEREAARRAYAAWTARLETAPPPSDCAADALEPGSEWNPFIEFDQRLSQWGRAGTGVRRRQPGLRRSRHGGELARARGLRRADRGELSRRDRSAARGAGSSGSRSRAGRSR